MNLPNIPPTFDISAYRIQAESHDSAPSHDWFSQRGDEGFEPLRLERPIGSNLNSAKEIIDHSVAEYFQHDPSVLELKHIMRNLQLAGKSEDILIMIEDEPCMASLTVHASDEVFTWLTDHGFRSACLHECAFDLYMTLRALTEPKWSNACAYIQLEFGTAEVPAIAVQVEINDPPFRFQRL